MQTGTNKLRKNPPNYDIYQAFASLPNLESLTISLKTETSHKIPENTSIGLIVDKFFSPKLYLRENLVLRQ